MNLSVFQAVQATVMSGFIVEDMVDDILDEEEDESNEDEDVFDSVCAFCDNGGELLWYVLFQLVFWYLNLTFRKKKKMVFNCI